MSNAGYFWSGVLTAMMLLMLLLIIFSHPKARDPWYVIGVASVGEDNAGYASLQTRTYGPFHSRHAAAVFRRRYAIRWNAALTVTRGKPSA